MAARNTKPKKVGRPTKRTPDVERIIFDALGVGCSIQNAAKLAGIDGETIHNWKKADPDFLASCEKAKATATRTLAGKLFSKAEDGDITSLIFWLKCRAPEFREPKDAPPKETPDQPDERFA